MSSLLQFEGKYRRSPRHPWLTEIGLEFVRYVDDRHFQEMMYLKKKSIDDCYLDPKVECTICGKSHPQIGVAYRRPRGMLGCWVQFQYLGSLHSPDLSVPISVPEWPKGTYILNQQENSENWHRG
jgi:hypothetical protein